MTHMFLAAVRAGRSALERGGCVPRLPVGF